jgi:hypothetical protein
MRTTACLIVLFLLSAHSALGEEPLAIRDLDLTAQMCFLRYEDNGTVNILEAKVALDNYQALVMMGGQAACVYLAPGTYSFSIQSPDPYHSHQKQWRSPSYKVTLAKNDRVLYRVYPTGTGGYSTWRAELIKMAKN